MSETFTLTVNGVTYTGAQRAAAGIHMGSLELYLDGSSYDQLTFTEVGGSPFPLFSNGQPVILTRDSDSLVCFTGEITDKHWSPIPKGWGKAYTCQGLRYIGDRVPATWTDGTGEIVFNREPQDAYYVPSLAGLTVGEMIELALTVPFTATLLDSMGIGQYVSLSPPTLPATTLADLALMSVVPAKPVTFAGESLLNIFDQFIPSWMPRFVQQVRPDGLLRYKDTTDIGVSGTFIPRTLTLPGDTGPGDTGIQWPTISSSVRNCATAVMMRGGPEAEAAWETLLDGTLVAGWSAGDQSTWTLFDFTQPNDAYDTGTITALTSTSATIQSDDPSVAFAINFWNGREGNIMMTDLVAAGISQQETRLVTSNTAMVAGGTATITWDSSWPITLTSYTRYRLVGTAGGKVDVGRLYYFADAATGDFGLNSYIGARLVVRSPTVVRVANNDKTFGEYYGATATVCNSSSGLPPFVEIPAVCEVVPAIGGVRFTQPTQNAFATKTTLEAGYPATDADGRPSEVRVLAVYSRGALSARSPSSGFAGTAYTVDGLEVIKYSDFPDWIWKANTTSMTGLADEYLFSLQDIVWEGTVSCYGFPTGFDALIFENAINFDIDGGTSPWTAMNAVQRSVRVDWGNGAEAQHFIQIGFSSLRKPFTAESLYVHPQYAPGSPLTDLTTNLSAGGSFGVHVSGPGFDSPLLGPGGAINAGPGLAAEQAASMVGLTNSLDNQMANLGAGQIQNMVGMSQGIADQMSGGMGGGGSVALGMGGGAGLTARESVNRGSRAGTAARRQRRNVDLQNRNRAAAPIGERENRDWQQSLVDMGSDYIPNQVVSAEDSMRDPRSGGQPAPEPAVRPRALEMPRAQKRAPLFVGPPKPKTSVYPTVAKPQAPRAPLKRVVSGLVGPGEAPDPFRDPRGATPPDDVGGE